MDRVATDVPVRRPRGLVPVRSPRAHDELGRRARPGVPRPALRLGRLRRPGDHRPLGADRRGVHEDAARHPLDRAERGRRRRRGRPRPGPRRRGRPGRAARRLRAARRRRLLDRARTAASPTSRTPTGAACAPSSGGTARACSGSRSGTRAASSSSAAATRRSTGTRRSSTDGRCRGSRRTTPITPATTAASRGRGCARPSARRRRCSRRCARVSSTARPARDPRRRGLGRRGGRALQPRRVGDALLRPLARRACERRPARLPEPEPRRSSANDDGLITHVALQRPWDGGAYGRVEVKAADGTKAWTNPLWTA